MLMISNYSISHLSLSLLLVTPFVSRSLIFEKGIFDSYNKIVIKNSFYSFLYSKSSASTIFKSSLFSKFQGQSPILMKSDFKSKTNYGKSKLFDDDQSSFMAYNQEEFVSTMSFVDKFSVTVSFDECSFIDCVNEQTQGGAIHFRKETASLIIKSCVFIRCKSYKSAGAIYAMQLYNGDWIEGYINITNSLFEECCDCNQESGYVAGVIDAYVSRTDKQYAFVLRDTKFVNCQFDKANKIIEAQVRLNANIFHFDFNNFTNSNEKVDVSAIVFVKYVQDYSTLSFFNGLNQFGFSFFEIYDPESGYLEAYNINMINTTFVNFNENAILKKVAFFNIFLQFDNFLYIDNFYAIDFTTIFTDVKQTNAKLIEPVFIKIPDKCVIPKTYNIYSNKKFASNNQVNYKIIPDMNFDYERDIFLNMPPIEKTPTPTPTRSSIPKPTTAVNLIEEITITPTNINNAMLDSIGHRSNKDSKVEIVITAIIALVIIITAIGIVINVIIQKRKNHQSNFLNDDDNDSDDNKSNKDDETEDGQRESRKNADTADKSAYELFYNPKNKFEHSDSTKMKSLIHILVNNDPFQNDIEEYIL